MSDTSHTMNGNPIPIDARPVLDWRAIAQTVAAGVLVAVILRKVKL